MFPVATFSDRATSFLFIGFGFRRWYIRILLHILKAGGHYAPSFALEDADFFTLPDQRQTVLFLQNGHFMGFRQHPWPAFARELRERFEQRLRAEPHVPPARVELPDSAPTAFLCHEHRDKPQAESLVPQLQMRGIKVWLDKQNLLCAGASEWL